MPDIHLVYIKAPEGSLHARDARCLSGDEGSAERPEHSRRRRQQAGAAQRRGQRLLLRPRLHLLHPAPDGRPEEREHEDGRGHQVRTPGPP